MDLKNLLGSSSEFKILQEENVRLTSKWEQYGLLEGLNSDTERANMARLLDNQTKHIIAEANVTGAGAGSGGASFSSGTGEQWAGIALPLVRKVFAQFASKDFVSVQPMNLPSGLVFYLDFKYGTGTAGFGAGDNMYGNVSTFNDKMAIDEDVQGGLYGAGRFGYSINSASLAFQGVTGSANLESVNYDEDLTVGDFVEFAVTISDTLFDKKGVRAFRLLSGSVDVTTNPDLTRRGSTATEVVFVVAKTALTAAATEITGSVLYHRQPADNQRGDFEDGSSIGGDPISIPEINIELGSEPIVAKTRKLKAKYTPEFAQDLNAYHSIDAEAELTSLLSDYIAMEIDLEIMDMLIQDAATTERWSAVNNKVYVGNAWQINSSEFFNTQGQWFQTLGTKIQKVSNKIHQKTLRGGANFLVVAPEVATILESIPGYAADTDGDKMDFAMGVQKVGQLNSRYRVYKNPYMTERAILLGYRGTQFLEAGAVYAPYIPLIMTPLVYDPETFTPRKGLMTRYAKKMVRPEFYGRIFISDLNTI